MSDEYLQNRVKALEDQLAAFRKMEIPRCDSGAWIPTFAGFAVNPTGVYRYQVVGRVCTVFVHMSAPGTSNLSIFYVSAPFAAAAIAGMYWEGCWSFAYDNGALLATPGRVYIDPSGTMMVLDKSLNSANWTASGGKLADFTFSYEIG